MKQIKITTYSPNLVLSNKYLKVIIPYLEHTIFDEKVGVLFYKIKKSNKKLVSFIQVQFVSQYQYNFHNK